VENTGSLIRPICQGKDVMEKHTLNHRRGRNVRQAKADWGAWTKMVWNPAIPAPYTV